MKYLYYRIWHLLKLIKTNDMPATNAMLLMSFCKMLNLFTAFILISQILNLKLPIIQKPRIFLFTIPIGIIIYLVDYFFIYRKRSFLEDRYKNETEKQRITGIVILGLYLFATIFLWFYFLAKYSVK